jgi:chaperonin GroEL (HSP60 family)
VADAIGQSFGGPVLARAIYSEGVKNVAAGCNPMDLRRGSQKAVDKVLEILESNKRDITTSEEIAQVSKNPNFKGTKLMIRSLPSQLTATPISDL